jgi:hypothetical protein
MIGQGAILDLHCQTARRIKMRGVAGFTKSAAAQFGDAGGRFYLAASTAPGRRGDPAERVMLSAALGRSVRSSWRWFERAVGTLHQKP